MHNPAARLARLTKLTFLFGLLILVGLALYSLAGAQSGGGFGGSSSGGSSSGGGGGSFGGSSSRSSGSSSRGGSYSGGGYRGPVIINNSSGYGGGYGYGGGGGLSLLPLLVIGVIFFAVFAVMRRGASASSGSGMGLLGGMSGSAQAVMVQVIMAEGDDVKRALQAVAQSGDPDTDAGLARMLQEAALVVLRHPERWVYGDVQRAQGSPSSAEAQLGAWATRARAAFTDQTTSNYQNRDPRSGYQHKDGPAFTKDVGDLYLAVTLGAAAHTLANLPPAGTTDADEVRATLQAIASVGPGDLIRAEVVWSPDAEGEFLSEDEAIMKYPQAKKL